MTLKDKYELARQRQKATQRSVLAAIDAAESPDVIARLKHDLDDSSKERRRAFEAWMNEE